MTSTVADVLIGEPPMGVAYIGLLMGLPGIAAARLAAVAGLTGRGTRSLDLLVGTSATLEEGVWFGVLGPAGGTEGWANNAVYVERVAWLWKRRICCCLL